MYHIVFQISQNIPENKIKLKIGTKKNGNINHMISWIQGQAFCLEIPKISQ